MKQHKLLGSARLLSVWLSAAVLCAWYTLPVRQEVTIMWWPVSGGIPTVALQAASN